MEDEGLKNQSADGKPYVKPTVTRHTAASLVVGSGCGSCGQYVSASGGGGGVGGLCGTLSVNTYYTVYYH